LIWDVTAISFLMVIIIKRIIVQAKLYLRNLLLNEDNSQRFVVRHKKTTLDEIAPL